MLGPFHFNLWSNNFPALNKTYILTLATGIFEILHVRTFFFFLMSLYLLFFLLFMGPQARRESENSSAEGQVGKLPPD